MNKAKKEEWVEVQKLIQTKIPKDFGNANSGHANLDEILKDYQYWHQKVIQKNSEPYLVKDKKINLLKIIQEEYQKIRAL